MRGPLAGVAGSLLTIVGSLLIYVTRPMAKPIVVQPEIHSAEYQRALFDASKVYGKAGCGDQSLAEMTARHAVDTGVPAVLIAAQIATESNCNPFVVSNRGAVGLMQVTTKPWAKEFDFTKINLFNPEDNMTVGCSITSRLVKQYGLREGLIRYYGTGPDAIGLGGAGYAAKILQLTGRL
jgi:soluble lytic murein transglycosylase-like protein